MNQTKKARYSGVRGCIAAVLFFICPIFPELPLFSFGLLADAQYCDCPPLDSRFFRLSPAKVRECASVFNKHSLEFVVNLGDMIDRDFNSFDSIKGEFDGFRAPVYHALGNHDFEVGESFLNRVPGKIGLSRRYFDFNVDNWRFILMDGTDLSYFGTVQNSQKRAETDSLFHSGKMIGRKNRLDWNGGVGREQFEWLRNTLKKADRTGENVIIFCHFPVYPHDRHNVWNDRELTQLFLKHRCLKAFFSGHKHQGGYGRKFGRHFVNLRGMVETAGENAFAIVNVYENRLEVKGFGREPSRVLRLRQNRRLLVLSTAAGATLFLTAGLLLLR